MPYSLDGLNIVYTHQPATDNNDLLSGAPQSDLSLEIWDRLPFNLEDAQEQGLSEEKQEVKKSSEGREEEHHSLDQGSAFPSFNGIVWGQQNTQPPSQTQPSFAPALPGNVDAIQLLLSTLIQQQQQQQVPQLGNLSLTQLMAQQQSLGLPPSFLTTAASSAPAPPSASAPTAQLSSTRRSAPEEISPPPPAKRARSRKSSMSVSSPDTPVDYTASPESTSATTTPLSASEDKRRRNTAASARFRQKKKEREAALETKAKELQDQVTGLEKECETLRRENNWLKGLVVGVTGAGAAQNSQAATN
ncbi:hypothetical protein F5879DRAFT_748419 [Lentinula edodes]|uniref:uncharacterized protein n=1 Tax=Lentinula edodes TaxID=5353 RepID=UPI001E8DD71A|nr:uncharacterized protein C8R40DRAFT_875801 [Lentinula edodes]KAH7877931.1 hypothetical protein C8R40DRAFT_875801 [Lentinula edodes]KAJ3905307.1 hypothetical protein F5879DRAFT_748419 [Lentinula edodes]